MSEFSSLPFDRPGFWRQPVAQRISECNTWLENNPDHSRSAHVQGFVDSLAENTAETMAEIMAESGTVFLRRLISCLPFLNDMTDSEADIRPHHTARARQESTFDFLHTSGVPEDLWGTHVRDCGGDNCEIRVQSETDVVFYLKTLYEAIIVGLKLQKTLCVVITRTIAGNKCDVIIAVKETLLPLSVSEAKKPHSEENDKAIFALGPHTTSNTVGQNFNQLHNLKFMNGFERVYGMITTGNSFMLTCTDPFDDDELEPKLKGIEAGNKSDETRQPHVSPQQVDPSRSGLVSTPSSKATSLFTSQILKRECDSSLERDSSQDQQNTNKSILNMMILQVHNAWINYSTLPGGQVPGLPEKGKVYSRQIELQPKPNERSGYRQNFKTIDLEERWKMSCGRYFKGDEVVSLVRSLGSGASGDCCFAISEKQDRSGAIKFFYTEKEGPTSLKQAQDEKANWDKIYGTTLFETKVVPLGQAAGCLSMPYVETSTLDRSNMLENDAKILREALRDFATNDDVTYFLHRDVKWRHLGYFQKKLMLVDLGRVDETDSKAEADTWINNCVLQLTRTKGQDPSSPAPRRSKRRWSNTSSTKSQAQNYSKI